VNVPPDPQRSETADSPRRTRSLAAFTGAGYDRGRPVTHQVTWYVMQNLVFCKWWFPARWRPAVLRAFGAQIGPGVFVRSRVRVHWPWKLTVGRDCWIGEGAWLLNLEPIVLGDDVCLSQEALLCTGSHDRNSPSFEFDNAPITIEDRGWVAARAIVLRGVRVGRDGVVAAGVTAYRDVPDGAVLTASGLRRPIS
jgi:putative colanic acid biosynthesis acetyltransferase WcaF